MRAVKRSIRAAARLTALQLLGARTAVLKCALLLPAFCCRSHTGGGLYKCAYKSVLSSVVIVLAIRKELKRN